MVSTFDGRRQVRRLSVLCSLWLVGLASPTIAQIAFEDVTVPAGIGVNESESFGASWGDLNGDAYPDLFSDNHRDYGRLWKNNGDGTLTDITVTADVSNAFGPGAKENQDTHGAAWADIDNDGDQDLATTLSTHSGFYLSSDGAGTLTDRRETLGLTLNGDNGSRMPVLFDFNNDGRLDIKVVGTREGVSTFFRQRADGTFWLTRNSRGLTCPKDTQFAQLLDVDGVGPLELLCGTAAFPASVLDYTSRTAVNVPFKPTPMTSDAVPGDFNNDGRQDIFYIRGPTRLNEAVLANPTTVETHLEMTGKEQFRTVTITTAGSLATNLDVQNWNVIIKGGTTNDVYIGADGHHPAALAFVLEPSGTNLGIPEPAGRAGMFIGYLNGAWVVTIRKTAGFINGYFVFQTGSEVTGLQLDPADEGDVPMTPTLQLNTADGFIDATALSGLTAERCVSGVAADLDNDMDLDVFLGCRGGASNIANVVFENLGNGVFRKVSPHGAEGLVGASITDHAGQTESAVSADYDADGFVDVFVTNGLDLFPLRAGGQSQLFRNIGNANHWIEIDLAGVLSNRDGVGAKVWVTAGGVTQYREQNGGYHRWSQNHSRIHVGLAANTLADVTIQWPNGTKDTHAAVAADAVYRAIEGGSIKATLPQVTPPL